MRSGQLTWGAWSPLQNPATKLWFNPTLLSGAQGDSIGSMPNLADRSLITDLTATGAARPTLRQIRGRQALKYVRANAQKLGSAFLAGSLSIPIYTFAVYCSNDPVTTTTLCAGAPGSSDTYRVRAVTNTWPRGNAALGSSTLTKSAINYCDQPMVVMAKHNGASSIVRVSGFSDATGTSGTVSMTGFTIGLEVGGGNGYGGCIGEVIVANAALSAAEEAQYISYLTEGWHTTAARKQILPLGDSNTAGAGTTVADGAYRGGLDRWGQTAPGGYFIDAIGPAQMATLANSNHDGVVGSTIDDHLNGTNGCTAIATLLASQYLPDIIVSYIGINNCNVGSNVISATLTAYDSLLTAYRTNAPTTKVVVCTITDSSTAQTRSNINGVNAGLPALISAQNALGGLFTLYDANTQCGANNASGNFQDTLHLNVAGQALFLSGLQPVLLSLF